MFPPRPPILNASGLPHSHSVGCCESQRRESEKSMAMAQFAASNGASSGTSDAPASTMVTSSTNNNSSSNSSAVRPGRQEVQAVLSQFDAKINQMGDYPAKDIINALTKLAERIDFAQDIVSFLETKIHRVTHIHTSCV